MHTTLGSYGVWILIILGLSQSATLGQFPVRLDWRALPSLPNELGVAGPLVGVHHNSLIVAGGANFAKPVWESEKGWHDDIYVMRKVDDQYVWAVAGKLERPLAYGACVSTIAGMVCIGGNDASHFFNECFMLKWDARKQQVVQSDLPSLPVSLAYGQACLIGNTIYVAGGQTTPELRSAVQCCWSLVLETQSNLSGTLGWHEHAKWPGSPRAFNITVAQNNGLDDCLYLIGGRNQTAEGVRFLADCWEYNPRTDTWRARASAPQAIAAGTGIGLGSAQILVLSGDDGGLFDKTDELRDSHPGFRRITFAYQTHTDHWTSAGDSPANQVTTTAVSFDGAIVLPSGEIRPRVRTPKVWRIEPAE